MKRSALLLLLIAFLHIACVTTAHAGLLGATVDVTANYPTSTSVYDDPGDRVVTNSIEYPEGSYPLYNPSWQVDISDTQLTLTDAGGLGFPFAVATFNGFVMTVISGPELLSATADPSSSFSPVSITILGGNQLLLNYEGVTGPTGGTSIIDIVTASSVPEPSALALLGIGIVGITGYGWRSRRKKNAGRMLETNANRRV